MLWGLKIYIGQLAKTHVVTSITASKAFSMVEVVVAQVMPVPSMMT
jgi:hypothetical protein